MREKEDNKSVALSLWKSMELVVTWKRRGKSNKQKIHESRREMEKYWKRENGRHEKKKSQRTMKKDLCKRSRYGSIEIRKIKKKY